MRVARCYIQPEEQPEQEAPNNDALRTREDATEAVPHMPVMCEMLLCRLLDRVSSIVKQGVVTFEILHI
jgi:hypothetical protein